MSDKKTEIHHLEKIRRALDSEPTPGQVLARVVRLETILEAESHKSMDELYERAAAANPPAEPEKPKQPHL